MSKMILKNPISDKYYSISGTTLIILPDNSSSNIDLYGMSSGVDIVLNIPFTTIRTVDINGSVTDITVDNFSVYTFISNSPELIINPSVTGDKTIITNTNPFTLYDEFGDNVEVLFYTNDIDVTSSNLNINANWSPVDELDGDFEINTWTDESSTRTLNMTAIPKAQFIYKTTPYTIINELSEILVNDISTYTTSSKVKFLLSNDNVSWYRWNGLTFEAVSYTNVEEILHFGNTRDELMRADYSQWTHPNISIGVFLMDDNTVTSKIDKLGFTDSATTKTSQVSNLNFNIINTTPLINLTLDGLRLTGELSDADLTHVQYRVILNNNAYYPTNGQFTNLEEPPLNINFEFTEDDVNEGENTVRVEFKDFFGTLNYWQETFDYEFTQAYAFII